MLAVVDYKAGNLTSVGLALTAIGQSFVITDDPAKILNAQRVLFPGVGAAGSAMASLAQLGLDNIMPKVLAQGKPLMGICLGTQIIMSYSEENDTFCLGLMAGKTLRFKSSLGLKIPQIGWNKLKITTPHPILRNVDPADEFYFVHSYYPQPNNKAMILATTEYGVEFPSAVGVDNLFATQFHPEKSGCAGLQLLANFCNWNF